jgi:hypothetical protein
VGLTIIYLHDQGDNISITAESLGADGKAQELAHKIIQTALFVDNVYYSEGGAIASQPFTPTMQ